MGSIYVVDNATDLIAAVTAIGSGGGTVWLCPGTYTLTASLTLSSNLYLKGAGMEATIIELTASFTNILVSTTSATHFGVENLTIKGKGTPSVSTDLQAGISVLSGSSNGRFANCRFTDVTTGIQVAASNFCEVLDCEFKSIRGIASTQGQGYGALMENGGDHLIRGCSFNEIERHAVYLSAACSRRITGTAKVERGVRRPRRTPITSQVDHL
jgi:hypothetical protein